jgi:hypothetical protein
VAGAQTVAGATTTGAGRLMITGGGREIGKPIPILTLNPAWEAEHRVNSLLDFSRQLGISDFA